MGFGKSARRGCTGALLIAAAWPLATIAQQPAAAPHAKAKATHPPATAASGAAA
ncbi:MAG: hypothetical protein H7276_01020, partial [Caulobacter sp.]|nr:hypothetical protein [Vitreoscilla sp.]